MNYRLVKILAEESQAAAKTKIIDILEIDPISRIDIRFEITRVATQMSGVPAEDITKVELVDGSDVLFSLNGKEMQALNIYDRKCGSMVEGSHYTGGTCRAHYGIDFGRYLFDPVLALDPKRFKNLQLKISFTLTSMDASATAGSLEVLGHIFDEKVISPVGFLMSKEHYSYTCGAADSFEYIDLPTDHPYRKMLVRGHYVATRPFSSIAEVRIDEENEKKIPIDIKTEDYYYMMKGIWQPVHEKFHTTFNVGTVTYYVTPCDDASFAGQGVAFVQTGYQTGYVRGGRLQVVQGSPGQEFHGRVFGYLPHACFEFPFGKEQEIEDWYDVTKINHLRLRLRAGTNATNGTGAVVLQQLRRY